MRNLKEIRKGGGRKGELGMREGRRRRKNEVRGGIRGRRKGRGVAGGKGEMANEGGEGRGNVLG